MKMARIRRVFQAQQPVQVVVRRRRSGRVRGKVDQVRKVQVLQMRTQKKIIFDDSLVILILTHLLRKKALPRDKRKRRKLVLTSVT